MVWFFFLLRSEKIVPADPLWVLDCISALDRCHGDALNTSLWLYLAAEAECLTCDVLVKAGRWTNGQKCRRAAMMNGREKTPKSSGDVGHFSSLLCLWFRKTMETKTWSSRLRFTHLTENPESIKNLDNWIYTVDWWSKVIAISVFILFSFPYKVLPAQIQLVQFFFSFPIESIPGSVLTDFPVLALCFSLPSLFWVSSRKLELNSLWLNWTGFSITGYELGLIIWIFATCWFSRNKLNRSESAGSENSLTVLATFTVFTRQIRIIA